MMQIAKVSLFLAGSAAFTSAVRVTSRGRRMQPTDDTPNTAAQMANSIDGVNWAENANKEDVKAMWNDFKQYFASKKPEFDNSKATQLIADSMGNPTDFPNYMENANKEDVKAMWNDFKQYFASKKPEFDNSKATQLIADSMGNPTDFPNYMACKDLMSKESSSLQTEDKKSTNARQVAESLVSSVGSGLDIPTDPVTPLGFKHIAMEFLNQRRAAQTAAWLDSMSPVNAESFAHGNQEAAANFLACGAMASQWTKQQTADKAINKGDQQDLQQKLNRQYVAEHMAVTIGLGL